MVQNYALYLALLVAAKLIPFLPVNIVYRFAAALGAAASYFLPGLRTAVALNLATVMDLPASSPEVKRSARKVFENDARNWVDTLRIGRLTGQEILDSVNIEGWEHLEAAASEGRGIVLVGMHLGNFDLVGQALALSGYRVTVPVERMQPERLFRFLMEPRTSKGIRAVPLDRAARELVRALSRGEIAAVTGDRNLAGKGVTVNFFGKAALLPRSPASLARRTGAPLVVGVGVRVAGGHFQGYVTAPIATVRTDNAEADDRENTQALAAVMQGFVTRFADQWLVFSPIWRDGNAAATIEHPNEAAV